MRPFEKLLATARTITDDSDGLAYQVVDLLGEAQPCGFEEPLVEAGGVVVPDSWCKVTVNPEEARAKARMLLVAADEAEAYYAPSKPST
jgi:hypothetical protein